MRLVISELSLRSWKDMDSNPEVTERKVSFNGRKIQNSGSIFNCFKQPSSLLKLREFKSSEYPVH